MNGNAWSLVGNFIKWINPFHDAEQAAMEEMGKRLLIERLDELIVGKEYRNASIVANKLGLKKKSNHLEWLHIINHENSPLHAIPLADKIGMLEELDDHYFDNDDFIGQAMVAMKRKKFNLAAQLYVCADGMNKISELHNRLTPEEKKRVYTNATKKFVCEENFDEAKNAAYHTEDIELIADLFESKVDLLSAIQYKSFENYSGELGPNLFRWLGQEFEKEGKLDIAARAYSSVDVDEEIRVRLVLEDYFAVGEIETKRGNLQKAIEYYCKGKLFGIAVERAEELGNIGLLLKIKEEHLEKSLSELRDEYSGVCCSNLDFVRSLVNELDEKGNGSDKSFQNEYSRYEPLAKLADELGRSDLSLPLYKIVSLLAEKFDRQLEVAMVAAFKSDDRKRAENVCWEWGISYNAGKMKYLSWMEEPVSETQQTQEVQETKKEIITPEIDKEALKRRQRRQQRKVVKVLTEYGQLEEAMQTAITNSENEDAYDIAKEHGLEKDLIRIHYQLSPSGALSQALEHSIDAVDVFVEGRDYDKAHHLSRHLARTINPVKRFEKKTQARKLSKLHIDFLAEKGDFKEAQNYAQDHGFPKVAKKMKLKYHRQQAERNRENDPIGASYHMKEAGENTKAKGILEGALINYEGKKDYVGAIKVAQNLGRSKEVYRLRLEALKHSKNAATYVADGYSIGQSDITGGLSLTPNGGGRVSIADQPGMLTIPEEPTNL